MKKPAKIIIAADDDPIFGSKSVFANMPVRRGSVLYIREGLCDKEKYAGIPTEVLK